jgi:TonB family protein
MKRTICSMICSALLLNSQAAQAQPWASFFGWTINRSDAGCGMFNSPPDKPFALSESVAQTSLFRFPLASGTLKPEQQFSLLFDIPATSYRAAEKRMIEGETSVGADGKSGEIVVSNSLADLLGREGTISVLDRATGNKIGTIDGKSLRDVSRVLERCVRELRTEPVRGSGKPAVTPPSPRGSMQNWITADDYPPRAVVANASGTSLISLTVSADGRVSGCSILKSSGNGSLDERACVVFSRRARFNPSIDEDGAPTLGVFTYPVAWVLTK